MRRYDTAASRASPSAKNTGIISAKQAAKIEASSR